MLVPEIPNGPVRLEITTVSHKKLKKATTVLSLLNMALTRRRKRKDVASIAIGKPVDTAFSNCEQSQIIAAANG